MPRSRGFTLVEMLVVIAIIVILAAILFPAVTAIRKKGMNEQTKSYLRVLDGALRKYETDYGFFIHVPSDKTWNSDPCTCDKGRITAELGHSNWDAGEIVGDSAKVMYRGAVEYLDKGAIANTISPSLYGDEVMFADSWDMPIIYLYKTVEWYADKKAGTLNAATEEYDNNGRPDDGPEVNAGYENEFELWSAGDDKSFSTLRGGTGDKDNLTVTEYKAP